MTTALPPSFEHDLKQWLDLHAEDGTGVWVITIDGIQCVIKRRSDNIFTHIEYCLRFIRSWTLSWFCWFALGERPSARVLLRNGLQDEGQRLARLHAAGCHVPEILYRATNVLVLEYVGQGVPFLVRRSAPAGRVAWMTRVAQEMALFHQAGFVHGGAQLRNLMSMNERITRVDFEENIGEAMSRPLGQAYDVYQMVSSLAGLRGHEFTPYERQQLCNHLLDAYFLANPDPEVRAELVRMGRAFGVVKKYAGWMISWLKWRDIQGFLYVTNTLQRL
jgi:tRNA A-37 threonylcarbamoyl transferase component Bud32